MSTKEEKPRYGGRALRNGVMMVGPAAIAVAVRRPDGQIVTAIEPFTMPGRWSKDMPFVRGLVAFGGMIKLARSAARLEGRLNPQGSKVKANLPQLAPAIGAAVADRLTHELAKRADDRAVAPIEVVAGVTLPFLAFGVSGRMPGVRELWRYHGAEHKAVHTAEAGQELVPANARRMSRVHPRCGTVLAFWGLLGGLLARQYIESLPKGRRKAIAGALSGPAILSVAYELSRLGAQVQHHPLGKAIFGPAWQTQRLTTAEPDDDELEVACAALQAVIDYEKAHA
jgi:uncharacterized protein YqhQ